MGQYDLERYSCQSNSKPKPNWSLSLSLDLTLTLDDVRRGKRNWEV